MNDSMLVGRSIIVVEDQPFVSHCLQIRLEGAGAKVHCATSSSDALHVIGRNKLSAAVLDCSRTAKGRRSIAQQLVKRGIPFVLCKNTGEDDIWPGVPILFKPLMGAELVEMLCRLILARAELFQGGAVGTDTPAPTPHAEIPRLASQHSLGPSANLKETLHGKS